MGNFLKDKRISVNYTHFKLVEKTGSGPLDWNFTATVIKVTTTRGVWGRDIIYTPGVEVTRTFAGGWIFTDTGEEDKYKIDSLEREYCAECTQLLEFLEPED